MSKIVHFITEFITLTLGEIELEVMHSKLEALDCQCAALKEDLKVSQERELHL